MFFVMGYMFGLIGILGLVLGCDVVFLDESVYYSLCDVGMVSGLLVYVFCYGDVVDLVYVMVWELGDLGCLMVVMDGMFLIWGFIVFLKVYVELLVLCEGWFVVDELYVFGCVGVCGCGVVEFVGIVWDCVLVGGLMVKVIGVYGGIVIGVIVLIE